MMADSGARGSKQQMRQLAGMRGRPSPREIIETPITANFREGLNVLQYFISTHGARKGLADTALKTANSGYLTRRLVDVAQDVIITSDDCQTLEGSRSAASRRGEIIEELRDRIVGRTVLEDLRDPLTGEVILERNALVDEDLPPPSRPGHRDREDPLRADLRVPAGVCIRCYGRNLATGRMVERERRWG